MQEKAGSECSWGNFSCVVFIVLLKNLRLGLLKLAHWQLKPTVWNNMRSLSTNVSLTVISHRKYTTELINYNFYETVSRIANHSILAQDLMAEYFDFQKFRR